MVLNNTEGCGINDCRISFQIEPEKLWMPEKQTLISTSINHAELIALYEARREALRLRSSINHIFEINGFTKLSLPTTLCEDNAACIHQIQRGYMRTKHISPKIFYYTHRNAVVIHFRLMPSLYKR